MPNSGPMEPFTRLFRIANPFCLGYSCSETRMMDTEMWSYERRFHTMIFVCVQYHDIDFVYFKDLAQATGDTLQLYGVGTQDVKINKSRH